MHEASGAARGSLDGPATPGRRGKRDGTAGAVMEELRGIAIASITARRGTTDEIAKRMRAVYGVGLPEPGRRLDGKGASITWAGPDTWRIAKPGAAEDDFEAEILEHLKGLAAVVELTHAVALFRLSGERIRDVLAKGFTIDLHPRAFGVGRAAVTVVAHVTVQIAQVADAPVYEIAVPRSLAASFRHGLEASAGEFGLDVRAPVLVHGS